jgi:hypothetical protein
MSLQISLQSVAYLAALLFLFLSEQAEILLNVAPFRGINLSNPQDAPFSSANFQEHALIFQVFGLG